MDIQEIIDIHESYRKSVHTFTDDLKFWNHFLNKWAIPQFQEQNEPRVIHSSGYGAYDHSPSINEGYFKMSSEIRYIHSEDLQKHSDSFFNWLMNLSVVRSYNALEILILKTINAAYLDEKENEVSTRKEMNAINAKIDSLLKEKSTRHNNKHLIQFLIENCPHFALFIDQTVRIDAKTTWGDFFYLISVLRHSIVHQAMIMHREVLNDLNSKTSRDFFNRYFSLTDAGDDLFGISPIQDRFGDFLDTFTEFAVNTLKFVGNQQTLDFLKMA